MDNKTFFKNVLVGLGIAQTNNALNFLLVWQKHEGGNQEGRAKNNPLNTTYSLKDTPNLQSQFNSVGVKNYLTEAAGIKATINTLKLPYYKNIVQALRSGQTYDQLKNRVGIAKELKTWGTHTLAATFIDGTPQKIAKLKKEESKPTNKLVIVLVGLVCLYIYLNYFHNKTNTYS